MLFYNDGASRVCRKPLSALEIKNIIPTIKLRKMALMVWGCISSRGVGKLAFIENTINAVQYLEILKSNLKASAEIFGLVSNNKPSFKFYQDMIRNIKSAMYAPGSFITVALSES